VRLRVSAPYTFPFFIYVTHVSREKRDETQTGQIKNNIGRNHTRKTMTENINKDFRILMKKT
jgi:hypothetical protein